MHAVQVVESSRDLQTIGYNVQVDLSDAESLLSRAFRHFEVTTNAAERSVLVRGRQLSWIVMFCIAISLFTTHGLEKAAKLVPQ